MGNTKIKNNNTIPIKNSCPITNFTISKIYNTEVFISNPPHKTLKNKFPEIFDFSYKNDQDFEFENLYELFLEILLKNNCEKEFDELMCYYEDYKGGIYNGDWFDFIDKTDTPLGECYFWGSLGPLNKNKIICIRIY